VTVRILIAEDQQLVRQGLVALLAVDDVTIVGEAEDGKGALEMARTLSPDVVLMDLSMPELDGVEATRRIKQVAPQVRVLVLTVANCERRVAEALAAGADGYALKKLGHAELMAAITAVCAGKTYLGPGLSEDLVKEYLEGADMGGGGQLGHHLGPGLGLTAVGQGLFIVAAQFAHHQRNVS
jgi:DNA-binding NarL/FixJ family response regulator